jgi:YegS/Rv2252/BmrU family lipid kinase
MTRVLVLHNPVSGTHEPDATEETVHTHFQKAGWNCQIHRTEKGDGLPDIVSRATKDGVNIIVAAGGDGTINDAASGLLNTGVPLGVLPLGTGNGMATYLKIPEEVESALALITGEHAIRRIDALAFNGRHALLNISAGLSTQMIKLSKREQKRSLGILTYYLAGIKALAGIQPAAFEVEVDGNRQSIRASEVFAVNTVNLGSSRHFLDLDIENDDGVLDVFIFRSKTAGAYIRLLANVLLRRSKEESDLERYAVRERLVIRSTKPVLVQADGDLIGNTPIEVSILPKAVSLIVPKN